MKTSSIPTVIQEITSSISSLNMPPDPINHAKEETFLAQTDKWAKHSVEHSRKAISELNLISSQIDSLRDKVFKIYKEKDGIDQKFEEILDIISTIKTGKSF